MTRFCDISAQRFRPKWKIPEISFKIRPKCLASLVRNKLYSFHQTLRALVITKWQVTFTRFLKSFLDIIFSNLRGNLRAYK